MSALTTFPTAAGSAATPAAASPDTLVLAAMDWDRLGGTFTQAIYDTLTMVLATLVIGGLLGLVFGMLLYTTRPGGVLSNKPIYWVINFLVNFVRPIPFIILLTAIGPLSDALVGSRIGLKAAVLGMVIAATFGAARIVEQNLVS